MRNKFSEGKLVLSAAIFAASLACAYYGIFVKPAGTGNGSFGFIILALALGRFSVLLFKSAGQKHR
jgi:hypothetical protein